MPYVIFNKQNNQYIRHPYKWVNRLSAATKFKTEENAKKFLACPPRALVLPSPDDIEILSADNLPLIIEYCRGCFCSADINTNYTFTEETAQQEFEELKQFLSSTLSSFDKLASLPKFYGSEVQKCDQETLDILHKIEFCNVSASDGYKLYKQLQEIRIRRRDAKDHLEIASLVLSTGLLSSMKALDGEIKSIETNMANRKYKPRVLIGLFDDNGITEIEEDESDETESEETA